MLDNQTIALKVAEALREIATRQGNVPFDRGDLRKSHVTEPYGSDDALLSANTPYARAVHDGRPAIVIRPKRAKALRWKGPDGNLFARSVAQPARKPNPWLTRAIRDLEDEGVGFLAPDIGSDVADALTTALKANGLKAR